MMEEKKSDKDNITTSIKVPKINFDFYYFVKIFCLFLYVTIRKFKYKTSTILSKYPRPGVSNHLSNGFNSLFFMFDEYIFNK